MHQFQVNQIIAQARTSYRFEPPARVVNLPPDDKALLCQTARDFESNLMNLDPRLAKFLESTIKEDIRLFDLKLPDLTIFETKPPEIKIPHLNSSLLNMCEEVLDSTTRLLDSLNQKTDVLNRKNSAGKKAQRPIQFGCFNSNTQRRVLAHLLNADTGEKYSGSTGPFMFHVMKTITQTVLKLNNGRKDSRFDYHDRLILQNFAEDLQSKYSISFSTPTKKLITHIRSRLNQNQSVTFESGWNALMSGHSVHVAMVPLSYRQIKLTIYDMSDPENISGQTIHPKSYLIDRDKLFEILPKLMKRFRFRNTLSSSWNHPIRQFFNHLPKYFPEFKVAQRASELPAQKHGYCTSDSKWAYLLDSLSAKGYRQFVLDTNWLLSEYLQANPHLKHFEEELRLQRRLHDASIRHQIGGG